MLEQTNYKFEIFFQFHYFIIVDIFKEFLGHFLFRNRKLSFLHSLRQDTFKIQFTTRVKWNFWDKKFTSLVIWETVHILFTVDDFTSSYIAPCFPPLPFWCGLIMVWVLIHEWRLEIPSRIPWASSFVSFPPDVLFFVPRFFSFTCECIQKRICKQSNKGGSRRESQTCKNLSWKPYLQEVN